MTQRHGLPLAAFAAFTLSPKLAFAYIDPGTGSMLIQAIIGAVAVGAITGKLYWYKLKTWFSFKQPEKAAPEIEKEGGN